MIKFDALFNEQLSVEQLTNPQKVVSIYHMNPAGFLTIVNGHGYYRCDVCGCPTKWRNASKQCLLPICSEDCWIKMSERESTNENDVGGT